MVDRIWVDGVIRDMTAEEQAEADKVKAEWNNSSEKLKRIKRLRLEKLVETDWWVLRGNMSEAQTTYRQSMRDIPQDYSEADYDDLLARDQQGNLTHTVWSKP
jgi:hypothetical protein|tara:strand:+ start:90 stop:398 length:309 start_codon:yes stop_codon:yes gene_type:complete